MLRSAPRHSQYAAASAAASPASGSRCSSPEVAAFAASAAAMGSSDGAAVSRWGGASASSSPAVALPSKRGSPSMLPAPSMLPLKLGAVAAEALAAAAGGPLSSPAPASQASGAPSPAAAIPAASDAEVTAGVTGAINNDGAAANDAAAHTTALDKSGTAVPDAVPDLEQELMHALLANGARVLDLLGSWGMGPNELVTAVELGRVMRYLGVPSVPDEVLLRLARRLDDQIAATLTVAELNHFLLSQLDVIEAFIQRRRDSVRAVARRLIDLLNRWEVGAWLFTMGQWLMMSPFPALSACPH